MNEFKMRFDLTEYRERRARLCKAMGKDSIAILSAAPEMRRNGADNDYPYRQNSDFYYLTGFEEPEAVAVFVPGRAEGEFILFNREQNPEMAIWEGERAGQTGACEQFGADESFPFSLLDEKILDLLKDRKQLYCMLTTGDASFQERILDWIKKAQAKVRAGGGAPVALLSMEAIVHEMRLIKSKTEIACMRKAAEISAQGHIDAMKACTPGKMEYELEASLQYAFTYAGSRSPAYPHIVGSGANSCVLHYNQNNNKIMNGDLVLIDAGAEYQNYASDVTRTFPANGRFSTEQRAVYQIVLETQLAVIQAVKPGVLWSELQVLSEKSILSGLINIGILSGDLEALMAQGAWKAFYMHKFGHWLGLDVHDVGNYKINGAWRPLEPGMVLTVEPGIYISGDNEQVDPKWWNIGVRIEDDILVTEDSCEVLSSGAPKTIEAIEDLMAH